MDLKTTVPYALGLVDAGAFTRQPTNSRYAKATRQRTPQKCKRYNSAPKGLWYCAESRQNVVTAVVVASHQMPKRHFEMPHLSLPVSFTNQQHYLTLQLSSNHPDSAHCMIFTQIATVFWLRDPSFRYSIG
jgi:hypothetical protein